MAFDEKITEIMRNIGIAENTLMTVQLEITALEARATAAEAKVAVLREALDNIANESSDAWARNLARAALQETDNG